MLCIPVLKTRHGEFQEEVKAMEERLDNLNADFSAQCRREMTLKGFITDLEKEISEQQASKVSVRYVVHS